MEAKEEKLNKQGEKKRKEEKKFLLKGKAQNEINKILPSTNFSLPFTYRLFRSQMIFIAFSMLLTVTDASIEHLSIILV